MEYRVKVNGKTVSLPKYTLNVEKLCSGIIDSGKKYNSYLLNAEELLTAELDFLKQIIGDDLCESCFGTDIEQMDIHEVDSICCDIVTEYQRPAREKEQKKLEAQYAPVEKLMNKKGVVTALNVAASKTAGV